MQPFVLHCIVKRQQALPELCRQRVYDDPGRGRNDPLVLSPQARPQPSPSPRVPAMFSAAAREEGSSGSLMVCVFDNKPNCMGVFGALLDTALFILKSTKTSSHRGLFLSIDTQRGQFLQGAQTRQKGYVRSGGVWAGSQNPSRASPL